MKRLLLVPLTFALVSAGCGGGGEDELPQIVSFTVDREAIAAGETVTLSWDTKNATSISISSTPTGLVMLADLQASGTYTTGALGENTTFKLEVVSAARKSDSKTVSVTVSGVGIISFTATPDTVARGTEITLAYTLAGTAQSTKITNTAGDVIFEGPAELTGMAMDIPQVSTTYTLTVTSAGAMVTGTTMVTVTPVLPEITAFTGTEAIIGEPVVLAWRTTNAVEVQVSQDGTVRRPWNTSGAAAGTVQLMALAVTNTFKLEARNPDGMVERELTVTARERPIINTFTLTPESYNGTSVEATLTWATEHTTEIEMRINNQVDANFPTTMFSGTYNFTVSGGDARVTLIARNPAAESSREAFVREGFIEPEPNDRPADAIMLDGMGVPYRGTLGPDDLDLYSVEVPQGARIYALAGVAANGMCTADTAIRLIAPDGVTDLGFVDEVIFPPIAPCAEMNPAPHDFADVLDGGTYYLSIEPGLTHTTTETYSLIVQVTGPDAALPGITYTQIGTPPWQFSDCTVFSTLIGDPGTGFAEFVQLMDIIFRPLHAVEAQAAELLNETPHTRSYAGELTAAVRARGLEPKTQFTEAEFMPPQGLGLFCMMVPSATATIGMTFDAANQPLIPHSLFPMGDVIAVTRDGVPYGMDFADTRPSFVDLGLNPPGDGLSHRIVRDIESTVFGAGEPAAGAYQWRHTVTDTNGEGWQVDVNFEVQ